MFSLAISSITSPFTSASQPNAAGAQDLRVQKQQSLPETKDTK
jgi:hypothetical protein